MKPCLYVTVRTPRLVAEMTELTPESVAKLEVFKVLDLVAAPAVAWRWAEQPKAFFFASLLCLHESGSKSKQGTPK